MPKRRTKKSTVNTSPAKTLAEIRQEIAPSQSTTRPKTQFLDLPLEIRNEVYSYLLSDNDRLIFLTVTGITSNNIKLRQTGFKLPGRRHAFPREKHVLEESMALLLVNRQVHDEALPYLYGENRFDFDTTIALKTFVETVGPGLEFLKEVWIATGGCHRRSFLPAVKKLGQVQGLSLRELNLSHADVCPKKGRTAQKLVEDIRPLLQTVHKSYGARDLDASIADVVHVRFDECQGCWNERYDDCIMSNPCGCTCYEGREASESMTREIGELIARRFGVEYHHDAGYWHILPGEPGYESEGDEAAQNGETA